MNDQTRRVRSFSYPLAEEIAASFHAHSVDYLFIGKSGAIVLGYADTTQDADLFVRKDPENGARLVGALRELGFGLTDATAAEITRGKDFVQIREGPFDIDLIFAPDGIETYEAAARNAFVVQGIPVCHIDDIVRSKEAAGREKDIESLPRLREFATWVKGEWAKCCPPQRLRADGPGLRGPAPR